jgi:hypothetical protein
LTNIPLLCICIKWIIPFRDNYYYHSKQEPVYFTGEDTTVAGKIKLLVFTGNKDQEFELFIFSITENTARGEWKKNETSKSLSFSVSEAKIPGLPVFEFVFTTGSYKLNLILQSHRRQIMKRQVYGLKTRPAVQAL